jgi:hypothetical protein
MERRISDDAIEDGSIKNLSVKRNTGHKKEKGK